MTLQSNTDHNGINSDRRGKKKQPWRNYMYRSHAMWQCWRKCFVVELFAGTTGKDFTVLLFIFIPFHFIRSILRRLPQFFRDHTMSSLFTFSYSPFLELLEAVWVLSVCVSEQFGQKQKTRESHCAVKWGQNVDYSPPSGWQNLEIKGLYMKASISHLSPFHFSNLSQRISHGLSHPFWFDRPTPH